MTFSWIFIIVVILIKHIPLGFLKESDVKDNLGVRLFELFGIKTKKMWKHGKCNLKIEFLCVNLCFSFNIPFEFYFNFFIFLFSEKLCEIYTFSFLFTYLCVDNDCLSYFFILLSFSSSSSCSETLTVSSSPSALEHKA